MNIKTVITSLSKALALMLTLVVLFPSVLKLTHAFTHHEHQVCLGESNTHLHASDFDCDFYKFKLTNSLFFEVQSVFKTHITTSYKTVATLEQTVKNAQPLTAFLRGPPSLM